MRLYGEEGISDKEIQQIESILTLKLPQEFIEISEFYGGGYLGGIENYSFNRYLDSTNIIDETLRLREAIKLPVEYIVLAEPPESIIVLNTIKEPSIIWCHAVEVTKLSSGDFQVAPDTWGTYAEFFAYLLDEEEEEQAE